ncbi:MAG: hypothetical protein MK207_13145 [Saprospiraceae bacterium]|nr:hypothetical protein [Saprospiraceae bacterium]
MNKIIIGIILTYLLLNICACSKYDPIYGVAGHGNIEPLQLNKDLTYIHDNDIFLANEILTEIKQLTFSQSLTKTHVTLSPEHDKIAYLNSNGSPVIIDTSGNQIDILNQYNNVKDIHWHSNNGNTTLYFLVNNNIVFHGPPLNIPIDPFSYVFPSDTTYTAIDALDINDNLDIAFSYRYQNPYSSSSSNISYYYGVGVNNSLSTDKQIETWNGFYSPATSSYNAQSYSYYYLVKFNEEDQNISLGNILNGFETDPNSYTLSSYIYGGTSNTLSTLTTTLSMENYYQEHSEGDIVANEGQIQKYIKVLPQNVPSPTGTPNTFILNFSNSNNNYPTYFDWNP